MLYGSLDGRGVWGRMDTCICMAKSLCCSSETITTLLIGYTPIQNKRLAQQGGIKITVRMKAANQDRVTTLAIWLGPMLSVMSNSLGLHGLYSPWNFPGQNTGVGSCSLLQGIFPKPVIDSRSPTLRMDSLPAEPPGKPKNTGVGCLSLLQWIFPTQELNGVSYIAGRFLTS